MALKPAKAWTSRQPVAGYRHFRLVLQGGKGSQRWVELAAVLDAGTRARIAWRDLHNREQWTSGWQRFPPDDDGSLTKGV